MRRRSRRRRGRRRGRRKTRRVGNEREREVAHVGGEDEDPSGSPWTTRREDPSITCVPHLFPVARTCRTSSPLQRRRWGSQVPSFALIVLGSLASRKKRVIIRGHCAPADVKKIVCACSQSPMCVRWKVRVCAAIDKWLELPCVLLANAMADCRCAFKISLPDFRKQWYLTYGDLLPYYFKSLHHFYNLRVLTFSFQFRDIFLWWIFTLGTIGNARKEKVVNTGGIGEGLGQEKRDCPAWKEEDDGSALSEARLCVNVWLAFGRQPWQIALLGWQPGSLSTRSSHLTAATHRDSTLYSPPPLVLLHSASSSSFNRRKIT